MHAVVTSFEYVSGLNNAAPYASLVIKAMSKYFRCLKNAITDQLQFANKAHFHMGASKRTPPACCDCSKSMVVWALFASVSSLYE